MQLDELLNERNRGGNSTLLRFFMRLIIWRDAADCKIKLRDRNFISSSVR